MSMIGSTWADDDNFSCDCPPQLDRHTAATKAVNAIIKDICNRRSLRQAWESIDTDICDEIRLAWIKLVETA